MEDEKSALADYNEAIRIQPDNSLSYSNRGRLRTKLGDLQSAISDCTKAIEINRNWGKGGLHLPYLNRGIAKHKLGDKEGAISDYTESIRLKPDFSLPYENRAVVRDEIGDKEGAIADREMVIRLRKDLKKEESNVA